MTELKNMFRPLRDRLAVRRRLALVHRRIKSILLRPRIRHLCGPRLRRAGRDDVTVVCLVRDGASYLCPFLEHYRSLGIRRFVFLDNGSTDGTIELLEADPDVSLYGTAAPYRVWKDQMKMFLTSTFAGRGWALLVDIDELFDWPYRDRLPLPSLIRYLNDSGYNSVVSQMLDMFPEGALSAAGPDWRREHRFYDLVGLDRRPYRAGKLDGPAKAAGLELIHGGMRAAKFGVRPFLTKHPLLSPARGARVANSHWVDNAKPADLTGLLLHFKYVPGFLNYAKRVVDEGSFYQSSAEYKNYIKVFDENMSLQIRTETSRELERIEVLVDEGFLAVGNRFRSLVTTEPPNRARAA